MVLCCFVFPSLHFHPEAQLSRIQDEPAALATGRDEVNFPEPGHHGVLPVLAR
jgi:hypothetical protein